MNLTSVAIPNGVSQIGASVFSDCYGLVRVAIGIGGAGPAVAGSLDGNAFSGYSILADVTVGANGTSVSTEPMVPTAGGRFTGSRRRDGRLGIWIALSA